jgi:axial budding pattern protein 2
MTFTCQPNATLTYSARGLPRWASFRSSSLSFSGHPTRGRERSSWITVRANCTDGTSAVDKFRLLTVNEPAPRVNVTFADQLPQAMSLGAGYVNELDKTVRVPPGRSFALHFASRTVVGRNESTTIYYSASETGKTRLPSWLRFDNRTVTFSGTAPPQAKGTRYEINVFASDHYGYGDVHQKLDILIASHSFDLIAPFPTINATAGSTVNYTIPLEYLRVDNRTTAASSSHVTIDVNFATAPYLSYDHRLRLISGHLSYDLPDRVNTHLLINLTSQHGDTLATSIPLRITSRLFVTGELPTFILNPGHIFYVDLSQYVTSNSSNYSAVIKPEQSTRWMSFDAARMQLRGTAPQWEPSYGDTTVELSAFDASKGIHAVASLPIRFPTRVHRPIPRPPPFHMPIHMPTSVSSRMSPHKAGPRVEPRSVGIGLGITCGIVLLIGFCLYLRHRCDGSERRKSKGEPCTSMVNFSDEQPSSGRGMHINNEGTSASDAESTEAESSPHTILSISDDQRPVYHQPDADRNGPRADSATYVHSNWGPQTPYSNLYSGFEPVTSPSVAQS